MLEQVVVVPESTVVMMKMVQVQENIANAARSSEMVAVMMVSAILRLYLAL